MNGRVNKLNSFFVVYLLVGKQLIDMIPSLLRINPQLFLWGSTGFSFFLAMIIISKGIAKGKSVYRFDKFFAIFLFMFLYQMIIDVYVKQVYTHSFPNPYTYFLYGIGICFVPANAIRYTYNIDYDWILKWLYKLMLALLILTVIYNSVLGISNMQQRSEGADSLGPLTYGHLGVTFSLLSLHLFNFYKGKKNKILYLASFFFGMLIMFISSSRSPFVALILCSVLYLTGSKGLFKGIFVLILLVLPIIIFWENILGFLSGFHGEFIYRLMRFIEEGDSSGRDIIYQEAIKQFQQAPIFGNSFLIRDGLFSGYYPHNLFLEALMATGVVGAFCFLVWIFKSFRFSFYLVNLSNPQMWIAIIFFQYFLFGMISKSLYTNNYLWYYAFLLWNVYYTNQGGNCLFKDIDKNRAINVAQNTEVSTSVGN